MEKTDQRYATAQWATYQDVASHLQVSAGTVRNWVSVEAIPFHRIRRFVRFDLTEIDRWVRGNGKHLLMAEREAEHG